METQVFSAEDLEPPGKGDAHVYFIDHSDLLGTQPLITFLNDDEQERAERFKVEPARAAFITTRAALRILTARYLHLRPRSVAFTYGPQGKPACAPPHDWLTFSVSHTTGRSVIAFARDIPIGIDIEYEREITEWESIAEEHFTQRERQEILAAPDTEHNSLFLHCWARKEAYVKAIGGGISIPLHSFDVGPLGSKSTTTSSASGFICIYDLALESGYAGTLAACDHSMNLHCNPVVRAREFLRFVE